MKRTLGIFLLFILTLNVFGLDRYSVLFLSSYDSAFPTFKLQYDGIIEGLGELNKGNLELHMDFLDSKQFPYDEVKNAKYRSLLYKIEHSRPFDYVIASDDNALKFILEYKQELFKNTPVVFFGVNNIELALSQNEDPFISGFIEDISYLETVESISKLLPDAEELYILHDSTTSGSADYTRIRKINKTNDLFDYRYLSLEDLTFDELYDKISGFKINQPLLLLSAFSDRNGNSLNFHESVSLLSENSGAPIFHLWGHGIGNGLIGGKVVDHKYYAKLSGKLIKELIDGADIGSYRVSRENENRYLFDHGILTKYNIKENSLPPGSILINKKRVFSDQALRFLLFLVFIIAILAFTIIVILKLYKSKSIAEKKIRSLNLSLEKEKESLAITLRSIGDGVIVTDHNCNITFINNITASMTGWDLSDVYEKPLDDVFNIVHEHTNEKCENPAKIVKKTGKIIELANHTCLIAKNGNRYIIEDSAAPIKDHDGKLLGVIIVFRDTTEKKQLRDSVNNNQKLESLGVLAGGIAHDFNNYLGGVIGFVELARIELSKNYNKEIDSYLSRVLDVSGKAISLTQQLLTFSKGGKPMREISNLQATIKHSTDFALSGSNIVPEFHFDRDLWSCHCDINQLSQCIDNLVINAAQSMPEGGKLTISAKNTLTVPPELEQKPHILIRVSDKGSGISSEIINRIFDPFYSTKESGHGLGLATVFSIIKNHDGTVKVDSVMGIGSTFSIYLPASPEAASLPHNNEVDHHGSGEILILDDQQYIVELLQNMLESLGYSIKSALTSDEALAIIKLDRSNDSGPNIMACILDQTIPGDIPGYRIASKIKEIAPDLPLIASSGYSDEYVLSHPKKYDFAASIQKPFTLNSLSIIMDKTLGNVLQKR